jgi:hypothetical protein
MSALTIMAPLGKVPHTAQASTVADRIEAALRRFIYFADAPAYTIAALWPMHTHLTPFVGAWTPYLLVNSPRWECGKSQLLDVLSLLVLNPKRVGRLSEATAMRWPRDFSGKVTMLLDEADAYIGGEMWRGLLNDGAKRGGQTALQVKDAKQETGFRTITLPVFCPKAIAMIDSPGLQTLHGATLSRCITLRMEPAPVAAVEPFELLDGEDEPTPERETVEALGAEMATWAAQHVVAVKALKRRGVVLDASNRLRDTWLPLVLIADTLGGEWPRKVREALAWAKSQGTSDEQGTPPAIRLLADLRTLYVAKPDDAFVSNTDLIAALNNGDHDFAWQGWNKGTGLRPDQLSAYLRPLAKTVPGAKPGKQAGERGRTVGQLRALWSKWLA